MRKTLKKLSAVALTAGMLVSSFTSGIAAQEETKELKKGTVVYGLEEVTDVADLTVGERYLFTSAIYGADDAMVELPSNSAIFIYGGDDIDKAMETGSLRYVPEYLESYEIYRPYIIAELRSDYALTPEEVYKKIAEDFPDAPVPTSWEEVCELDSYYKGEYGSGEKGLNKYIAEQQEYYDLGLEYYPESEADFLELEEFDTWDDFVTYQMRGTDYKLSDMDWYYYVKCTQKDDRDGYITVIEHGEGFHSCEFYTMAYLEAEENANAEVSGWYCGCYLGCVSYEGPYYMYSYKEVEFTADDLIVTYRDGWKNPTEATTVVNEDITLSIMVDDEEIIIPSFAFKDADVDPINSDTTITVAVGEVEKEVVVCKVDPGEVDKDVQIFEGAPTVALEDEVEELKEVVLTEEDLELIESGVNVDIYMTVAGKDEEDLGEDKVVLEAAMDEGDKAVYLDLKLFKKIGDNQPTAISEVPGGKIKVSIEVPAAIKAFAANAKVVRVHGTEVTELATTYDATTNKLTFETDRFSTYAIVYNEAADNTGSGNENPGTGNETPGTGNQTPDAGDKAPDTGDKAPDAGDSSMVGLYIAIVAIAAVAMVMRKRVTSM